ARRADGLRATRRGPAPSRFRTLTELACSLFGEPVPANRYEASILIARMTLAVEMIRRLRLPAWPTISRST
ncbi:MAG: hypothetical protein ACRDLY_15635, partial [Thermoleophilaceae bacterium]